MSRRTRRTGVNVRQADAGPQNKRPTKNKKRRVVKGGPQGKRP